MNGHHGPIAVINVLVENRTEPEPALVEQSIVAIAMGTLQRKDFAIWSLVIVRILV